MIAVRRAEPADAPAIAAVHVAAWRSAYPGILPDDYLANLSVPRHAGRYEALIRRGGGVFVAAAAGSDLAPGGPRVVGFCTVGRAEGARPVAEGEVETLYVLDDWRERGLGRRLLRAGGAHLAAMGCRSVFLWVLRDNPSRWFYRRLGGVEAMQASVDVAGRQVPQTAYAWIPVQTLLGGAADEGARHGPA